NLRVYCPHCRRIQTERHSRILEISAQLSLDGRACLLRVHAGHAHGAVRSELHHPFRADETLTGHKLVGKAFGGLNRPVDESLRGDDAGNWSARLARSTESSRCTRAAPARTFETLAADAYRTHAEDNADASQEPSVALSCHVGVPCSLWFIR